MKKSIVLFVAVMAVLFFPFSTFANIGVGVGTGKIQVDQQLKPGMTYTIPPLTVVNTGDEPSEYTVSIDYGGNQMGLKPNKEWFSFEPLQFRLEPNMTQLVQIKLTLAINAKPGDYFAYVQAQPAKKVTTPGGTTIGVVAAAKLYFKVVPANIFQGIYYRFMDLYSRYRPFDTIVLAIILGAIILRFLKKNFQFQVARKK